MGNHSIKVKKELNLSEVGLFLRDLADGFDGKIDAPDGEVGPQLQDFHKIEIKMKRQMTAVSIKMKVSSEEDDEPVDPGDETVEGSTADDCKPKYKKLKKRMGETFKTIGACLSDNRLPDQETVQTFIRDALLMVSYPGYGDEYYESFVAACQRFSDACEHSDWNGAQVGYSEIDQLKKDCHDRYK